VVKVGIECSGTYGRPAAVALSAVGTVEVAEVPVPMTVRERNRKPSRGKSDPIDALAVARSWPAVTDCHPCAVCPSWPMTRSSAEAVARAVPGALPIGATPPSTPAMQGYE
jgi:hypothetical protein